MERSVRTPADLARTSFEDALTIPRDHLGAEHLIVGLLHRSNRFIGDLSRQPFIGGKEASTQWYPFISQEKNGAAII